MLRRQRIENRIGRGGRNDVWRSLVGAEKSGGEFEADAVIAPVREKIWAESSFDSEEPCTIRVPFLAWVMVMTD